MPLQNLHDSSTIQVSELSEGLIIIFLTKPESEISRSQLENFMEKKSELAEAGVSCFFVTSADQKAEGFYADIEKELIGLSEKADLDGGDYLVCLENKDGNIKHFDTKESPESDEDWLEAILQLAQNYKENDPDQDNFYKWGQIVPQTGEYLCKDCGYIIELDAGDIFPICEVCLSGEPSAPSGPNEGYWELV